MNDLLQAGIMFFNEGRYYEAHESWEDLWRGADPHARRFSQGLVQVAVGLHHRTHGNTRGGNSVLRRGMGNLETYPECYMGVDNASLLRDCGRLLETEDTTPISVLPC